RGRRLGLDEGAVLRWREIGIGRNIIQRGAIGSFRRGRIRRRHDRLSAGCAAAGTLIVRPAGGAGHRNEKRSGDDDGEKLLGTLEGGRRDKETERQREPISPSRGRLAVVSGR